MWNCKCAFNLKSLFDSAAAKLRFFYGSLSADCTMEIVREQIKEDSIPFSVTNIDQTLRRYRDTPFAQPYRFHSIMNFRRSHDMISAPRPHLSQIDWGQWNSLENRWLHSKHKPLIFTKTKFLFSPSLSVDLNWTSWRNVLSKISNLLCDGA